MDKYRSRKFCILLYMDNDEHRNVLELIRNNYEYALIKHDKDIDEKTGELKKTHIHVVLSLENAKWNTALSTTLNLDVRFIQKCRNEENALNYLIHLNDDNKHQYDINEIEATNYLKSKLENQFFNNDKNEHEKILELINYIKSNKYISITEFSDYCAVCGRWDVFRRSALIFMRIIEEHNYIYIDKNQQKD